MSSVELTTLGFDFQGRGAAEAERAFAGVAKAAGQVETATASAERSTASLANAARGGGNSTVIFERSLRQQRDTMTSHAKATNLTSHELTNLGRQFADITTMVGTGQNPLTTLLQQGPQVADVFAQASARGVGFRAAMGGVLGMVSPMVAALGGAAIAIGAVGVAWLAGESSALRYERAVSGIGRTAGLTANELQALARAGAEQGNISIRAAQDQATAYLATGRIGREVLDDLIRIGRDYASFMGMDATDATKSLATAMLDPEKAAREMTRSFGLLTQAQIAQIDAAMKAGDQSAAQTVLLQALDAAVANHASNVGQITNAWDAVSQSLSNAITRFGEWLYVTNDEKVAGRVQTLQRQIGARDRRIEGLETGGYWGAVGAGMSGLAAFRPDNRAATADRLRRENAQDAEVLASIQATQNTGGGSAATAAAARQAQANQRAQIRVDNQTRAPRAPSGPSAEERRVESLARELAAMRATTEANYALAKAYGESDAAALRAAAAADATGRAIRRQGEIDDFVSAQLQLNASRLAASAGRQVADLRASSEAQERANAMVASGVITSEQAREQMELELLLRPLIAAAAVVEGQAKADLLAQIDALTQATARYNNANGNARGIQSLEAMIKASEREAAIVGKSAEEQARLNVQWAIADMHLKNITPEMQAMIDTLTERAGEKGRLEDITNELRLIDDLARSAGDGLANSFGEAGRAMGDLLSVMSGYAVTLDDIHRRELAGQMTTAQAVRARGAAEQQAYGDALGAAKQFFGEGTTGYKILHAAEAAYRTYQMISTIQAMAMGGTETTVTVGQNLIKAASHGVVAVARAMASLPFPLNLAAGAATIAALAAIGVKLAGGGGGGGGGRSEADTGTPANDWNDPATVSRYRADNDNQNRIHAAAAQGQAQGQVVEVRVTADRDGLNAYVVGTAQREAVRVAVPMGVQAASAAKRDTMATLQRQQEFSRYGRR